MSQGTLELCIQLRQLSCHHRLEAMLQPETKGSINRLEKRHIIHVFFLCWHSQYDRHSALFAWPSKASKAREVAETTHAALGGLGAGLGAWGATSSFTVSAGSSGLSGPCY